MTVVWPVWNDVVAHARDIAIAYALALPVGWDRERAVRSAGVRTFPLVAIATCGLVLISQQVSDNSAEARARVLQGLITGTGFLAAGVVLKEGNTDSAARAPVVQGMTTAASIWAIGVVGTATGFGLYDIAVLISVVSFVTLRALQPVKVAIDASVDASEESEAK